MWENITSDKKLFFFAKEFDIIQKLLAELFNVIPFPIRTNSREVHRNNILQEFY